MVLAYVVIDWTKFVSAIADDAEEQNRDEYGAQHTFLGFRFCNSGQGSGAAHRRSLACTGGASDRGGVVIVHSTQPGGAQRHGGARIGAKSHRRVRISGGGVERAIR